MSSTLPKIDRVVHRPLVHGAPREIPVMYVSAPDNSSDMECAAMAFVMAEKQSEMTAVFTHRTPKECTFFHVLVPDGRGVEVANWIATSYRYHHGEGLFCWCAPNQITVWIVGTVARLFSPKDERVKLESAATTSTHFDASPVTVKQQECL